MRLKTEQLASFFERYRGFTDSKQNERVSAFKDGFTRITAGFEPIRESWLADQKKEAPGFNIFEATKVVTDEVWHSSFLAGLLDVRGKHGQGTLFIDEFIRLLEGHGVRIPDGVTPYYVRKEKYVNSVGRGFIDIVIEFRGTGRFAIIIENKIRHGDSDGQMHKYYESAKSLYDDFLLVYLSPKGKEPSENSIDEETRKRLMKKYKLVLLSYNEDISGWLEDIVKEIEPKHLLETINMYVETVKGLKIYG